MIKARRLGHATFVTNDIGRDIDYYQHTGGDATRQHEFAALRGLRTQDVADDQRSERKRFHAARGHRPREHADQHQPDQTGAEQPS